MSDPYESAEDYAIDSYTVTDGDTIRAFLADDRPFRFERIPGGWTRTITEQWKLDPVVWPRGRALRLVTLNTPEIHAKDPAVRAQAQRAKADLQNWLETYDSSGLRVVTWEIEGNFDRLLADIYVAGRRDLTASQYMLSRGWEPYNGSRTTNGHSLATEMASRGA